MRRLTILALLAVLASPAWSATYYVRKAGNDTTGDGSTGAPWLTIAKGYATIAAGDTLKVGVGTYAEDTAAAGYLNLARAFASQVVIESESGSAADVVIRGASHAVFNTYINNATRLTLRNLTFSYRVGEYPIRVDGDSSNIVIEGCRIVVKGLNITALLFNVATGKTQSAMTVTNVTITQDGTDTGVYGIRTLCAGTGTLSGLTITNPNVTLLAGTGHAIALNAGTSTVTITGGTLSATGTGGTGIEIDGPVATVAVSGVNVVSASMPFRAGADGAGGAAITGLTVSSSVFRSTASHGLLIGSGPTGATATDVVVYGYDQGLVLKSADTTVTRAYVTHSAGTGLYCKGCSGCIFQDSTVVSLGGYGIRIDQTGAVVLPLNTTWRRNRISTRGSAVAFSWSAANDGGGNVVDANIYSLCGSGRFGVVLADADVQTLTELRAAWDGYGAGTNDDTSRAGYGGGTVSHYPAQSLGSALHRYPPPPVTCP